MARQAFNPSTQDLIYMYIYINMYIYIKNEFLNKSLNTKHTHKLF